MCCVGLVSVSQNQLLLEPVLVWTHGGADSSDDNPCHGATFYGSTANTRTPGADTLAYYDCTINSEEQQLWI